MRFPILAAFGLLVLVISSAFGQGKEPTVMERSLVLLRTKPIQTEVRVSPAQIKLIESAYRQYQNSVKAAFEKNKATKNEAAVRAVEQREQATFVKVCLSTLGDPQKTRLKQLWLQYVGPFVLKLSEVAQELGLTADQKKRLDAVWKSFADKGEAVTKLRVEQVRKIPQPKDPNDKAAVDAYQKKVQAFMKAHQAEDQAAFKKAKDQAEAKIVQLLNAGQKAKWSAMQGKKFAFPKGIGAAGVG